MTDSLTVYDITWSPDGRQVAFTREYYDSGRYYYRVVTFNSRTGIETVLTPGPDDSFQPAWSPDGMWIAYLTRPVGGIDATLRSTTPDASGDHQVGTLGYFVRPPKWSPDGRKIAATRNDLMVVIVDATTGALLDTVAAGFSPTWSPDGQQVAFVANAITIWTVGTHTLRTTPAIGYDPDWSPDGDWIAYDAGSVHPRAGVYLVSPTATDSTGVRFVAPYDRPAWRFGHYSVAIHGSR